MASRSISGQGEGDFDRALRDLHAARLRPELRLTEVPAPTRIAPHAVAMTVDVLETAGDRDDEDAEDEPDERAEDDAAEGPQSTTEPAPIPPAEPQPAPTRPAIS